MFENVDDFLVIFCSISLLLLQQVESNLEGEVSKPRSPSSPVLQMEYNTTFNKMKKLKERSFLLFQSRTFWYIRFSFWLLQQQTGTPPSQYFLSVYQLRQYNNTPFIKKDIYIYQDKICYIFTIISIVIIFISILKRVIEYQIIINWQFYPYKVSIADLCNPIIQHMDLPPSQTHNHVSCNLLSQQYST